MQDMIIDQFAQHVLPDIDQEHSHLTYLDLGQVLDYDELWAN